MRYFESAGICNEYIALKRPSILVKGVRLQEFLLCILLTKFMFKHLDCYFM